MNNRGIVLASLVLAIILVAIHHVSKKMPDARRVDRFSRMIGKQDRWAGKFAPDFELQLVDGGTFRLADVAGKKVIILNFFTTWCGPCRVEMPELNRFYLKHKDEPFIMVGIDCDEKEDTVAAFLGKMEISFPVGIDRGGKIMKKFGVEAYPTTILIDSWGKVKIYETGAIANADVSFEPFLAMDFLSLEKGMGIGREAYLDGQRNEDYGEIFKKGRGELRGRAGEISGIIYCPCGRGRHLADCNCSVARRMKRDLRKAALRDETDEEIISELCRKYCVKRP